MLTNVEYVKIWIPKWSVMFIYRIPNIVEAIKTELYVKCETMNHTKLLLKVLWNHKFEQYDGCRSRPVNSWMILPWKEQSCYYIWKIPLQPTTAQETKHIQELNS